MIRVFHWYHDPIPDVSWDIKDALLSEGAHHQARYFAGLEQANFPLPTVIGFVPSRYGTYLIDTRKRIDGMPLFRGYTQEQWNK